MRFKWCRLKWKEVSRSSEKEEAWSEVDEQMGEYLSPIEVVNRQGGWGHEEGIKRGLQIVETCCLLGGKFMAWNWQSKAWDVLLLRQIHREVYKTKWSVSV